MPEAMRRDLAWHSAQEGAELAIGAWSCATDDSPGLVFKLHVPADQADSTTFYWVMHHQLCTMRGGVNVHSSDMQPAHFTSSRVTLASWDVVTLVSAPNIESWAEHHVRDEAEFRHHGEELFCPGGELAGWQATSRKERSTPAQQRLECWTAVLSCSLDAWRGLPVMLRNPIELFATANSQLRVLKRNARVKPYNLMPTPQNPKP